MLKACINQVTTLSTPFEEDVPAYARAGWTALEIWLSKLEAYLQGHSVAEVKKLLADEGVAAVAASGQGGLLISTGAERDSHWADYKRRLEILAELEVPVLVIAADFVSDPAPADYSRAAASLAEAAALARPAGVRLALEFQKTSRFCASLDTALALIAHAAAPEVGVCLDLFHYYTGPSKFEDLAYLSAENLALVQVCDLSGTPRELAGDSDRILPGDGDFQLAPIVEHLSRIGYDGYLSLELLNPQLWPIAAEQVAQIGLQAVSRVLESATEYRGGP